MSSTSLTFSRPSSQSHFKFLNGDKMGSSVVGHWPTGLLAGSRAAPTEAEFSQRRCEELLRAAD